MRACQYYNSGQSEQMEVMHVIKETTQTNNKVLQYAIAQDLI